MPELTIDEFEKEVTAFLDANAERKVEEKKATTTKWGEGSDEVGLFEEVDREIERRQLAEAKEWKAKRYDAGLGWITGPKQYGGRELPHVRRVLRSATRVAAEHVPHARRREIGGTPRKPRSEAETAPFPVARIGTQSGADRVQDHVGQRVPQMGLGLDPVRRKARFEQVPDVAVAFVEAERIEPVHAVHAS